MPSRQIVILAMLFTMALGVSGCKKRTAHAAPPAVAPAPPAQPVPTPTTPPESKPETPPENPTAPAPEPPSGLRKTTQRLAARPSGEDPRLPGAGPGGHARRRLGARPQPGTKGPGTFGRAGQLPLMPYLLIGAASRKPRAT